MSITIKLFASLREQFGQDELTLSTTPRTVQAAWQCVSQQSPPANLLAAVNHDYVDFDHPLRDGDEVAFFPPVTGG
ncbi:MAG: molybdopterin converting factor subunit 1 [Halothiobacillus sp.]